MTTADTGMVLTDKRAACRRHKTAAIRDLDVPSLMEDRISLRTRDLDVTPHGSTSPCRTQHPGSPWPRGRGTSYRDPGLRDQVILGLFLAR
jgi:hypothetical protein